MTLRTGSSWKLKTRVQKYIIIKIIMSFLTGVLVFAVLKTLDVRYSMSFGLRLYSELHPHARIHHRHPAARALRHASPRHLQHDNRTAILLPTIIQIMIGSVLEPKIMGNTLGLHPVVILMALILGRPLGFSGMLLAVPMTAVTKIILSESRSRAPSQNSWKAASTP